MKYIDAEKLKAELERQKYELKLSIQSQGDYGQSCHIVAYENILSLIDSLQEEQPPLPPNLDEAAEEYAKTTFKKPYSDNPDEEITIVEPDKYAGFIAGARYEDEQLSEKIAAAYQLGLADKGKQMMSEAVEGTVYGNGVYTWVAGDIPSQFKYGDKVRVIVLPKEN